MAFGLVVDKVRRDKALVFSECNSNCPPVCARFLLGGASDKRASCLRQPSPYLLRIAVTCPILIG
jgi:hypothetical protein